MIQLILGGARCGKSALAEQRAKERAKNTQKRLIYIATATADDDEMAERIAQHQHRRGSDWQLVEETMQLAAILRQYDDNSTCVLVDCLTLWLSNCLHRNCWPQQRQALVQILPTLQADVILVSNEVGSGIVPLGQLSREFVDQSGWLHQSLAHVCEQVTLVVAGLPLELKQPKLGEGY